MTADRAGPANSSSACRCLLARSNCCWSAWPCTATRSSARPISSDTGTLRPPAGGLDRPSADTERLTIRVRPSSSSSPPASSTCCTAGPAAPLCHRPSTVAPPGPKPPLPRGPVRLDLQPPFDGGPVRAWPDPRRVGPAAEHQAEPGDDHGLACPGLAGHHGEAGRELKDAILDHPKAGDPHFLKHQRADPPSRLAPGPSRAVRASRSLGGRTWPPAGR